MKIFIGTDHRGFETTSYLLDYLKKKGHEVIDDGDLEKNSEDDFPVFARRVVTDVLSTNNEDSRGILLCGSGQGMCIAANRYKGIRACLCWNELEAKASRNDDDSNVLCLPASVLGNDKKAMLEIVNTWLETPFSNASRYARRIYELDNLN